MRKLILSAAAVMIALAAGAQNKAIDALVEKYTDAEGFTVVSMEGEAIKGLSSMIANGDGKINLGDGSKSYEMGELLDEIASVTAIILRRADEVFSREAGDAIATGKYSPIVSINSDGQRVKVSSADIRRGQYRGNQEIVALISDKDTVVLVRIIGTIDTDLLTEIINEANKS